MGGVTGPGKQIGFIAQIPDADAGVIVQGADHGGNQQTSGGVGNGVVVGAAVGTVDDFTMTHHLQVVEVGGVAGLTQQPARCPIGAAHMPRKKCHIEGQAVAGGDVGHGMEVL